MVDRTQQLIWTALPNGTTADRKSLRLSVLVSPRLVTTATPGEPLKLFPDFLDWAARVAAAKLAVRFNGNITEAVFETLPEVNVQRRLFDEKTFVRAHQFEDRQNTSVLTSPAVALAKDIAEIYGTMAVKCEDELPSRLSWFGLLEGIGGKGEPRAADVFRLLRSRRRERSPANRSPLNGTRSGRFALANAYNTPLSGLRTDTRLKAGPDDPREDVSWQTHDLVPLPDPSAFREAIDFHRIVSLLSHHPRLLRASGFRLDLLLPRDVFPRDVDDELELIVDWKKTNSVSTLPDIFPATRTVLHDNRFAPAPRPAGTPMVSDGYVLLGDSSLVEVDVNGSALKVRQFAINIANTDRRELEIGNQSLDGRDPVAPEPDRAGAPALRSGGIVLASDGTGYALEEAFDRSAKIQSQLATNQPIVLFQEDLLRGVRADVSTGGGAWRSLCRRVSTYRFLGDNSTLQVADEEGNVRLAASGSADGSEPDLLKVDAAILSWDGWSLTAPRPGRAIDPADKVGDPESLAPPGLPLEVDHVATARSLPSLRFGQSYQVRMRTVDLAGNARPLDENATTLNGVETPPTVYYRFEPVEAPNFALVGTPDLLPPVHGESLQVAAIRTFNGTEADNTVPTAEVASRHVVPPSGSQRMAELHGMLDTGGRLDPVSYNLLVARDGELATLAAHASEQRFPVAEAVFTLPFLPDPLSRVCRVRIAGYGDGSTETLEVPFYSPGSAWPDASSFRIAIGEGPRGSNFDPAQRILFVPLEKGEHVRVRLSHALERKDLALLGIYQWGIEHAKPDQQLALEQRAVEGRHWMLTPWRDLDLVHAVQKPLVRPAIESLVIGRTVGTTACAIGFATPVDSLSTEKLDLSGHWLDPVDDVTEPLPRWHIGGSHAAELKLARLEAPGRSPPGHRVFLKDEVAHTFPDTRYRRVGYTLAATTRFAQFMPEALREPTHAADLIVTSDEVIGFVPNSAPPPAPDIVYVVPTFGWTRVTDGNEQRSYRDGGGLRVYLRRPWLVTGAMEMLGVILPPAGMPAAEVDTKLGGFVTRWGGDPTAENNSLADGSPARSRFPAAVYQGPIAPDRLDPIFPKSEGELPAAQLPVTQLPMPGTPADVRVEVAPHLVGFDAERQLWFADIVLDPGLSYMPFIRLALARYQPISAPGAHLSPSAIAEIVQLTNDRLATLVRKDSLHYRVGLFGIPFVGVFQTFGARRRQARSQIEVLVERLEKAADEDFGWEPLQGAQVVKVSQRQRTKVVSRKLTASAETLRQQRDFLQLTTSGNLLSGLLMPEIASYDVILPRAAKDGERFRLVIAEREPRPTDRDEATGNNGAREYRIVYLEMFALQT